MLVTQAVTIVKRDFTLQLPNSCLWLKNVFLKLCHCQTFRKTNIL